MYRAVTWLALQKGVDLSDNAAVERLLTETALDAGIQDGQSCFCVEGVDPAEALVSPEVNAAVSKIATLPCVRTRLLDMQRQYGLRCHSVMEGRDIGSVVFPETPAKFYVDASVEVRAARRLGQGLNDPVALRDAMDSARKSSPLTVPAGADKAQIEAAALASEAFIKQAAGAAPKKIVVVPGRLVNLVI
jgi:cytidylate kinase